MAMNIKWKKKTHVLWTKRYQWNQNQWKGEDTDRKKDYIGRLLILTVLTHAPENNTDTEYEKIVNDNEDDQKEIRDRKDDDCTRRRDVYWCNLLNNERRDTRMTIPAEEAKWWQSCKSLHTWRRDRILVYLKQEETPMKEEEMWQRLCLQLKMLHLESARHTVLLLNIFFISWPLSLLLERDERNTDLSGIPRLECSVVLAMKEGIL
jgi:hypothetical protein